MRLIAMCEECLHKRLVERKATFEDPAEGERYLREGEEILRNHGEDDAAPYVLYQFNLLYEKFGKTLPSFAEINLTYDAFVLAMEAEIQAKVDAAEDPLLQAIFYSRIGNYIDFAAVKDVTTEGFLEILEKEDHRTVDPKNYAAFRELLAGAKTFLLLADNCGEIVLDKILVRTIKKLYPGLQTYVMVRGGEAGNDALMADARYVGMDREAELITNGYGFQGTVPNLLPEESRRIFDSADVILSKGQGNYETLHGCKREIFYSFLCKCDYFTTTFSVPRFTGMFLREKEL